MATWQLQTAKAKLSELLRGIERLPDGAKRNRLPAWFSLMQSQDFASRILPVDLPTTTEWGRLEARANRSLPRIDGLIAATALVHDLTLVTRNERDFSGLGVRVLNPWT